MNQWPSGFSALQASFAVGVGDGATIGTARSGQPLLDHGHASSGAKLASLDLLLRLRRSFSESSQPVIQFVAFGPRGAANAVAHGFAAAAAATIGRTVLIDAGTTNSTDLLPDAFIPRLYHQSLSGTRLYNALSQSAGASNPTLGMFSLLVVAQAAAQSNDAACVAAPFCTGTVLVVQAGVTGLATIKAATARIISSGGKILGSVLAESPA